MNFKKIQLTHEIDYMRFLPVLFIVVTLLYFIIYFGGVEILSEIRESNSIFDWIGIVIGSLLWIAIIILIIAYSYTNILDVVREEKTTIIVDDHNIHISQEVNKFKNNLNFTTPVDSQLEILITSDSIVSDNKLHDEESNIAYIYKNCFFKYLTEDDIHSVEVLLNNKTNAHLNRNQYAGGLTSLFLDNIINKRGLVEKSFGEVGKNKICRFCMNKMMVSEVFCGNCNKKAISTSSMLSTNMLHRVTKPINIFIIFLIVLVGFIDWRVSAFTLISFIYIFLNNTEDYLQDVVNESKFKEYLESRKWLRLNVGIYLLILVALFFTNPSEGDLQRYVSTETSSKLESKFGLNSRISESVLNVFSQFYETDKYIERKNYLFFSTFYVEVPLLDDQWKKVYGIGNHFIHPELLKRSAEKN